MSSSSSLSSSSRESKLARVDASSSSGGETKLMGLLFGKELAGEADFKLACDYEAKGQPDKAKKHFALAARVRHKEALYRLGRCWEIGIGCKENMGFAKECYYESAQQGYSEAAYSMAQCLGNEMREGRSEKEMKELQKWYFRAADLGHTEAQYTLGDSYRYGDYLVDGTVNLSEALKWYKKADLGGKIPASYYIAKIYELQRDIPEAITWYGKAAEKDYRGAREKVVELKERMAKSAASDTVSSEPITAGSSIPTSSGSPPTESGVTVTPSTVSSSSTTVSGTGLFSSSSASTVVTIPSSTDSAPSVSRGAAMAKKAAIFIERCWNKMST